MSDGSVVDPAVGWGVLVLAVGLLLCFAGGRTLRLGAFCAGAGLGVSLAGAAGAGLVGRLLVGAAGGLGALLLATVVVGTALVVVGSLAGGVLAVAVLQTTHPRGWGIGVVIGIVLVVALVCGLGVLRFRRPLAEVLTAVGGAGLVLQGVVVLGPSAIAFLRQPTTWIGSLVATAAWLALAAAGRQTQRRRSATSPSRR